MRTGRPIPPLTLTADERETLARWTCRPTTARALAERARVVLECAAGKPNTVVARELRLTKQTIGKWRSRFLRQRLDGLLDEPRPGAPRRIGDADVERVMRLTLETAPRAKSLVSFTSGTGPWNSASSSTPSRRPCRRPLTSI